MAAQKETLPTDTLGRGLHDLRISVTDRCNFRCPYCMPSEIYGEHYEFMPRDQILTFEEIARLAQIFADLGVRKVRLTGGEPLLRKDLPQLVELLAKANGIDEIALTTNGYLLSEHAADLKAAGLDRVTISLDSLDDSVFKIMSGRDASVQRVLDAIETASGVGLVPAKLNCMVQRGVNDHTIVALARHFKDTGHIVRFIEYMDVGNRNRWQLSDCVTASEIFELIDAEMPLSPVEPNYPGEVANRFAYADGTGEIGIIASVSQPFCGTCTRARLSTDGRLFTCLFAGDGVDLRGPIRAGVDDNDLKEQITNVWLHRTDRYSELRASFIDDGGNHNRSPKVEMYQIGG